ncbi:MAG: hypothetical protein IJ970_01340 [Mycoplasmataceae bacterium]|nr:hypothetical protein [Mycoplasmataceae bacterium]
MGNTISYVIIGVLIFFLVAFLVFTYIKDKNKNKKIIEKKAELRRATSKTTKELSIRIYSLIEMNEQMLKEVVPGVSEIKMKNVNNTCKKFLKDIYDSKAFKVLYIDSNETNPLYAANIKKLIDTSSNLWSKYCQEQIEFFKKINDELIEDQNFEKTQNESKELIKSILDNEVKKNNESAK